MEKAVSGDYNAMQEVIRLFKPYMTRLSIEDGRFNNKLFERLVQRLVFIAWQFYMHYSEK
ncbi:helix-turn-helix domain-containing protein [Petralouisia muris]|uniref:helix-turn-helix domain-containing protein n=1 Tax=Petralouisia muris TaxID=3032872 RepID=UPI0038CDA25C